MLLSNPPAAAVFPRGRSRGSADDEPVDRDQRALGARAVLPRTTTRTVCSAFERLLNPRYTLYFVLA